MMCPERMPSRSSCSSRTAAATSMKGRLGCRGSTPRADAMASCSFVMSMLFLQRPEDPIVVRSPFLKGRGPKHLDRRQVVTYPGDGVVEESAAPEKLFVEGPSLLHRCHATPPQASSVGAPVSAHSERLMIS